MSSRDEELNARPGASEGEHLTYREAIRCAIDHALAEDPDVLFLGEDIGGAGGVFKCSEGLLDKWGPDRVMDMPISEFGFSELALGLAITGMRPVVEIMFADFLGVAASPIAVDFPRYRLTSGGQMKAPITIRTVGGLGWHFGAQHSMTYESWLQGMPGLKIAVSSSPSAAYRNIRMAIADENPVLIIEHKLLLAQEEYVKFGPVSTDEIGRANLVRQGEVLTLVSSLHCVSVALEAAKLLAERGIEVEVIDIGWIKPLDVETVASSVAKTGRLLVLMEDYFEGSWASTLLAALAMRRTDYRCPPAVKCLPTDLPIPFAQEVEMALLPDAHQLSEVLIDMLTDVGPKR